MDQVNHVESYGSPSAQPAKRGRGRPRKQSSIKPDDLVGQLVTGVIEATFGAGYLLTVKIGNSNISLRGVVFKSGEYVPITVGNDVAPHIPMIQRTDVSAVASKRKKGPPKTDSSVPIVGVRGPVVLEPVNVQNGSLPTPNASQTTSMFEFGDEDVLEVEPISILPPSHFIPAGQIFANYSIHQISQADNQTSNGSFNEGTSEVRQMNKSNDVMAKVINNSGSSQALGNKTENNKEASPEDSGVLSYHEIGNMGDQFSIDFSQGASVSCGSGKMNHLLQENMKDNKGQIAVQQPINTTPAEANLP